jgi:hypothetical protein
MMFTFPILEKSPSFSHFVKIARFPLTIGCHRLLFVGNQAGILIRRGGDVAIDPASWFAFRSRRGVGKKILLAIATTPRARPTASEECAE